MKNPESSVSAVPNMGEVLGFMVDWLGVPKEQESYIHKDLERLRKGKLSEEKYWFVAHKVIVAILASFTDESTATETIKKIFLQKLATERKLGWLQNANGLWIPVQETEPLPDSLRWKFNKDGGVENLLERLVLDWIEFLERNEFLRKNTLVEERSPELIIRWATLYAIPFVAYNLIEYLEIHSSVERGMPAGQFWYLPEVAIGEDRKSFVVTEWPINKVLGWWEDLLGEEFYSNPELLFPANNDKTVAQRQVHHCRFDRRTPDQETILRWCKQNWNGKYKGVFKDNEAMPLHERWNLCRGFLVSKGLHHSTINWVEELPEQFRASFKANQYRGEPLELQILRFKEIPFAEFFDSLDPIAEGLPVAELIGRVAERYAQPTNGQLKARLLMAAAFQRAFQTLESTQGTDFAAKMFGTYKEIYDYLMRVQNAGTTLESKLQRLLSTPPTELKLRYACEWLLDKKCWYELPSLIGGNLRAKKG
jgi:hypothetical protein